LETLKKIYTDWEKNPRMTQYFNEHLKIDSFNYEGLMKSYAEIMELNNQTSLRFRDEENRA
jgi:hypothetical protein